MDATLSFNYPLWYIALCLLLGLVYAFVLYFKDSTFKDANSFTRKALKWLSVVRFLSVSALAFLLLSPLLKNRVTEIEAPIIIYAQDNSQSMAKALGDKSKFETSVNTLKSKLKEKFEVFDYQFADNVSEEVTATFDEKITNINSIIAELYDRYANQNIGAIILSTDGIFNEGQNPIYNDKKLNAPIYAIAVGDTAAKRDLKLDKVYHNKIAYLRDKFTIRIDAIANNCAKENTQLNISRIDASGKKSKVHSENIYIKNDDFIKTVDVVLDANVPGINQYEVKLSGLNNEESLQNNSQNIYVDILDARQKILLLAESPHPDLSALRNSIELNENYEVEIKYIRKFTERLRAYDMVIMHGLPSKNNPANSILSNIESERLPVLFVTTLQSNIPSFNNAQNLVTINGSGGQSSNSKAKYIDGFNLFTINQETIINAEKLPPLQSPFGKYNLGANAVSLFNQKIGTVETAYPLLVFEQSNSVKKAVLAGEGIWRWRLYDFQQDGEHDVIDELIGKTIQYLAVKNDKRQFRINIQKNIFYENEEIVLDAEIYNDSYELINESAVSISIKDKNGKEYPFTFDKTANAYILNAGLLPIGNYTFKGNTNFGGKNYEASGKFRVIPLQIELMNTTANHQMLNTLAEQTDGKVYYENQMDELANQLLTKQEIKPVLYSNFQSKEIINLRWLFGIIMFLLALEWFIRKFNGAY